jgi:NAD(P)-dependent dehydrogenase (short-subunit alcohol dehydrogenase family)
VDNFRGKVALITGSADGIGQALAGHAANEGMRLAGEPLPQLSLQEVLDACCDDS